MEQSDEVFYDALSDDRGSVRGAQTIKKIRNDIDTLKQEYTKMKFEGLDGREYTASREKIRTKMRNDERELHDRIDLLNEEIIKEEEYVKNRMDNIRRKTTINKETQLDKECTEKEFRNKII